MARVAEELEASGCQLMDPDSGSLKLVAPRRGECSTCQYAICPAGSRVHQGKLLHADAGHFFRMSGGNVHKWAGAPPQGAGPRALPPGTVSGGTAPAASFYAAWRGLDDIHERLSQLAASSNGLLTLERRLPATEQGHNIHAVRLRGAYWSPGGPRVIITFLLHAREWIAAMAGAFVVENITAMAQANPADFVNVEVVIIPVCNPDGFEHSTISDRFWRKNRRTNAGSSCKGVDLNRNFDKDWGGSQASSWHACSETYKGPYARSELESQAIADVFLEAPVTVHLDVHSWGEMILGPWSYSNAAHPRETEMAGLGAAMQDAIYAVHGTSYRYGTGDLNGEFYLASGILPDWTTEEGAMGFTLELSPVSEALGGFAPPASTISATGEECAAASLAAIQWARTTQAPTPVPTSAPTPAPGPMWILMSGPCTVVDRCVQSPNFPESYGVSQACIISVDESVAGPIFSPSFHTEFIFDFLLINGIGYSGTSGPEGVIPAGTIAWTSDDIESGGGWQLCPVVPTPPPTPAPPPHWEVLSGQCVVVEDCLLSPNFPSPYGLGQSCTISTHASVSIYTASFSTEVYFDVLTVNGVAYFGSSGPSGVTPTADITWTSDSATTKAGWRICQDTSPTSPPTPRPPPTPVPHPTPAPPPTPAPACGVTGHDQSPWDGDSRNALRIVHGQDASECEWKWQVALLQGSFRFCGGALVAENWVLTTAYCVVGVPQVTVKVGDFQTDATDAGEVDIDVLQTIVHPQYDPSSSDYDFALLELTQSATSNECVDVVCLPGEDVVDGTECFITGWGTLSSGGAPASKLKEAKVATVSRAQCSAAHAGRITDRMLCAQGLDESGLVTDVCQGDSGGPLVCLSGRGSYVLHGASSWGIGCADAAHPSVWSHVHSVRSWIDSSLGLAPAPSPAPPPTSASPPTQAPPPTLAPESMWASVDGACTIVGECLQSPNFPQAYSAGQTCMVAVDAAVAGLISAERFSTERFFDALVVNGISYSGPAGPIAVAPTADIEWSSDMSNEKGGWKLCPASTPSPTPRPPPTPAPLPTQVPQPTSSLSCGLKGLDATPWPDARAMARIANGQVASECEWKWQVALLQGSFRFCSGALISERWVLTTAYCADGVASLTVKVGDFRSEATDSSEVDLEVNRTIVHPLYNRGAIPGRPDYDFALLELVESAPLNDCVGIACLPGEDVTAGTDCFITGWGALSSASTLSSTLQEARVTVVSMEACDAAYEGGVTDRMLCAQGIRAGGLVTGACQGDGGGPMVCLSEQGSYVLHGASSWGQGCADPAYPSVWSRVSYVQNWIDAVIGAAPAHAEPTPIPQPAQEPAPNTTVDMWIVVSGDCIVVGGCVQSPNFPEAYGPEQRCEIAVDISATVPVSAEIFSTETYFDALIVNGVSYSGGRGPFAVTPTAEAVWTSDLSSERSGWQLCPATPAPTAAPRAPTPAPPPLNCGNKGVDDTAWPDARIVNGQDASQCEWRWQVALIDRALERFCGGTLISERWVLTAAHCVMTGPPFLVRAGDFSQSTTDKNEVDLGVAQVIRHPQYDLKTLDYDFALIELAGDALQNECIATACLPTKDVVVGSSCFISGWGALFSGGFDSGAFPDVLQEAEVQIVSDHECREAYQDVHMEEVVTDRSLCAQGMRIGGLVTDACQGDSGGPLVCMEGGSYVVHGATSWGGGCAAQQFPGVWARVYSVRDWIDIIVEKLPTSAPLPTPDSPWIRLGNGFCRDDACTDPWICSKPESWESRRWCGLTLDECKSACSSSASCAGIAWSEFPVDDYDGCWSSDKTRCIVYYASALATGTTAQYHQYACYVYPSSDDSCRDTNREFTDARGEGCWDGYARDGAVDAAPAHCGLFDDGDFSAIDMCCECVDATPAPTWHPDLPAFCMGHAFAWRDSDGRGCDQYKSPSWLHSQCRLNFDGETGLYAFQVCEECDQCQGSACLYNHMEYGSLHCESAWYQYSLTCEVLASQFKWNCAGCNCPGDHDEERPTCVGNRSEWTSGYGGCATYTSTTHNHKFCSEDVDEVHGGYAYQVCVECEQCVEATLSADKNNSQLAGIVATPCQSIAGDTRDSRGRDCWNGYIDPDKCGKYDDDDFTAQNFCCQCQGGAPALGCWHDYTDYGAHSCDVAWYQYDLTCAELLSENEWNCAGCSCPGDAEVAQEASPICMDFVPFGQAEWHDSADPQFNCEWYAAESRCDLYGDFYAHFGATARQACCACGGGQSYHVAASGHFCHPRDNHHQVDDVGACALKVADMGQARDFFVCDHSSICGECEPEYTLHEDSACTVYTWGPQASSSPPSLASGATTEEANNGSSCSICESSTLVSSLFVPFERWDTTCGELQAYHDWARTSSEDCEQARETLKQFCCTEYKRDCQICPLGTLLDTAHEEDSGLACAQLDRLAGLKGAEECSESQWAAAQSCCAEGSLAVCNELERSVLLSWEHQCPSSFSVESPEHCKEVSQRRGILWAGQLWAQDLPAGCLWKGRVEDADSISSGVGLFNHVAGTVSNDSMDLLGTICYGCSALLEECDDTSVNATNTQGEGCDQLQKHGHACAFSHLYDDADFTATDMCCACESTKQRACSDHAHCLAHEFCHRSGVCTSCDRCHRCLNGWDNTCDSCGPTRFPIDEPGVCKAGCVHDHSQFGAENCDAAWGVFKVPCSDLEADYAWNCTGCDCPGDAPQGDEAPTCLDFVPEGETEWHDADGTAYNCDWYSDDARCSLFGNLYANWGRNASTACCACGGGVAVTPAPTTQSLFFAEERCAGFISCATVHASLQKGDAKIILSDTSFFMVGDMIIVRYGVAYELRRISSTGADWIEVDEPLTKFYAANGALVYMASTRLPYLCPGEGAACSALALDAAAGDTAIHIYDASVLGPGDSILLSPGNEFSLNDDIVEENKVKHAGEDGVVTLQWALIYSYDHSFTRVTLMVDVSVTVTSTTSESATTSTRAPTTTGTTGTSQTMTSTTTSVEPDVVGSFRVNGVDLTSLEKNEQFRVGFEEACRVAIATSMAGGIFPSHVRLFLSQHGMDLRRLTWISTPSESVVVDFMLEVPDNMMNSLKMILELSFENNVGSLVIQQVSRINGIQDILDPEELSVTDVEAVIRGTTTTVRSSQQRTTPDTRTTRMTTSSPRATVAAASSEDEFALESNSAMIAVGIVAVIVVVCVCCGLAACLAMRRKRRGDDWGDERECHPEGDHYSGRDSRSGRDSHVSSGGDIEEIEQMERNPFDNPETARDSRMSRNSAAHLDPGGTSRQSAAHLQGLPTAANLQYQPEPMYGGGGYDGGPQWSAPRGGYSGGAADDGWRCQSCTYLNRNSPHMCEMCGTPPVVCCANGCGRPNAVTYQTCCRTCTESGGSRHGTMCDQRFQAQNQLALGGYGGVA